MAKPPFADSNPGASGGPLGGGPLARYSGDAAGARARLLLELAEAAPDRARGLVAELVELAELDPDRALLLVEAARPLLAGEALAGALELTAALVAQATPGRAAGLRSEVARLRARKEPTN